MAVERTFTREEVVAEGFEARCLGADGCRYLWHRDQGVRYDPDSGITVLLSDSRALPDGPWLATDLGELQLAGES